MFGKLIHTYLLIIQHQPEFPHELIRVIRVLKSDEAEAFGTTRLAIDHNCRIDYLAKPREKLAHCVCVGGRSETTNKVSCVSQVLFSGNRAFRVNLLATLVGLETLQDRYTNSFPIQNMLPSSDSIHAFRFIEGQESEAP